MKVGNKRLVVEIDHKLHHEMKIQAVREMRPFRDLVEDCFRCYMKQLDSVVAANEHINQS